MTGNLEWKKTDPNQKSRGAGWYWHRHHGIYSKYTGNVDRKVKAGLKDIKSTQKRGRMQMLQPHKHDYKKGKGKKPRTLRKKFGRHRVTKTLKGYY